MRERRGKTFKKWVSTEQDKDDKLRERDNIATVKNLTRGRKRPEKGGGRAWEATV